MSFIITKSQKTPIIVDVDLTFVDSAAPWMQWLEDVYGVAPDWTKGPGNGQVSYNLSEYFPAPKVHQIDPFEFWEDPYLYDKLVPRPGAVAALERMKAAGHPIRFGSFCKNGHFSSKARMLKRYTSHFLDLDKGTTGDGFYATKVKSGIAGGVIIDDRHAFLNQFGSDVLKIKFDTVFTQDEGIVEGGYDLTSEDWNEIADFVIEYA